MVLQVLPRLVTGGVERGTADVARALVDAGWTSLVASAGGPMVHELDRAGVGHFTLPLASKNPLVMAMNITRLDALIREHGVDIVHARSRAPAWSAAAAAQRTGAHFVTSFHGTYSAPSGIKRFYNRVMTRGQRVIAISKFIAGHIEKTYGVGSERVRVVHRGVDIDLFDPDKVSDERMIQLAGQWRLPDDKHIILMPGRLTRWKGQGVLIEALAKLGRRDVHCLIVGTDEGHPAFRRDLESQIIAAGLGDVVQLVGHCQDMPAVYMLSDVVVSPSIRPEAFGRVITEAQAMGRPVVVADHGGASETVIPGQTALLVPPRDAGALASALDKSLAMGAEARDKLARQANAHIRENFTKERMCRETLAVYREVLAPEEKPPVAAQSEDAAGVP
ncbi:MAG: glycosyltransferase family 4 protein [Alphaproteobacteria bacterium]